MVLLDSEGIDAAASEGFDDHQIFTLTVLLASVLIYNSQGVPTRHNVEQFEYPFNEIDKISLLHAPTPLKIQATGWSGGACAVHRN